MTEEDENTFEIQKPDEEALINAFTTSVQGKLFMVSYNLRVYVKHDALMEMGEGNCVTLPIRVLQRPMRVITKVQSKLPDDWSPVKYEMVNLKPVESNDFMKEMMMEADQEEIEEAQPMLV